jgi:hypothetical protein
MGISVDYLIDITYKSELTLDTNTTTTKYESYVSRVNSQTDFVLQLMSLILHKLSAH